MMNTSNLENLLKPEFSIALLFWPHEQAVIYFWNKNIYTFIRDKILHKIRRVSGVPYLVFSIKGHN